MGTLGEQFRRWVLSRRVAGARPVTDDEDHLRINMPTATAEVNLYPFEAGSESSDARAQEIVEYRV
ncbi:MAG: hypothetical protein J6S63_07740, partial [Atopobiaceae bacterium]|nr:hypothetical protein [Atopobiaceae bacterium]